MDTIQNGKYVWVNFWSNDGTMTDCEPLSDKESAIEYALNMVDKLNVCGGSYRRTGETEWKDDKGRTIRVQNCGDYDLYYYNAFVAECANYPWSNIITNADMHKLADIMRVATNGDTSKMPVLVKSQIDDFFGDTDFGLA